MKKSAKFDVSTRLLDHLGLSAYNSIAKSITELVANAYDADARSVEIVIPISISSASAVRLRDNGTGMSRSDVEQKFLLIGRNKRLDGERTTSGRLKIGSKGIGKLAGFGVANHIEIQSRKNKKEVSFVLDRSDFEKKNFLSDINIEITETKSKAANGTEIILKKLNKEITLPSPDELRRHIFRSLPISATFSVSVNGVQCSASDVAGKKYNFKKKISSVGTITGYYVLADRRQPRPGLAVRVRGRVVEEPSLFGINTKEHGYFTAEKIAGEVNADFLDPEGGSSGVDLISTARDGFVEDSPIVQEFQNYTREFLREIINGVEKKETKRRADVLLKLPAIKARIDKMPPHIQGAVTKVVRSLVPKLKSNDHETKKLIEWILKYYESNALRELMDAIVASDASDIRKLSSLVSDWGLRQVREIAELIKSQVSIVSKLEKMISVAGKREIDLHKLVEQNLWLIRDGLELWSSDKPLKVLLDGHIAKVYRNKKNLRPDLVCRSQSNGRDAVVLEFKRPSESIDADHITQALKYKGIIEASRPNIRMELFVVGSKYTAEAKALKEQLEKTDLKFWSYSEILQKARQRYEDVLKVLGR